LTNLCWEQATANTCCIEETLRLMGIPMEIYAPKSLYAQEYMRNALVGFYREFLLAFAMGTHPRLGSEDACSISRIGLAGDVLEIIKDCYFRTIP
jgi:hypothetical protein